MKATVNDVKLTFNARSQYKYNPITQCCDYCKVFKVPYIAIYCNHRYLATIEQGDLVEWSRLFVDEHSGHAYTFDLYPRNTPKTRKRRWFADWHGCHLLDLDTSEVLYEQNFDTRVEYISPEFKCNLYYWRKVAKEYKRAYLLTECKEDK